MKKTSKNDNNSFAPYKKNSEVESVVDMLILNYWQARLDKALDEKMYVENLNDFQKIVDNYLESKNTVDKS
ncbi:MAG: hypothetical protein ABS939_08355 [Psychrobacillus sp.]